MPYGIVAAARLPLTELILIRAHRWVERVEILLERVEPDELALNELGVGHLLVSRRERPQFVVWAVEPHRPALRIGVKRAASRVTRSATTVRPEAVDKRWKSEHGHAVASLRYGAMSRPSPSAEAPDRPPDNPDWDDAQLARAEFFWRLHKKREEEYENPVQTWEFV